MKKILWFFIASVFLVSCVSVIKRHYNSGYYISKINKKRSKKISQDTLSFLPAVSSHLIKESINRKDIKNFNPSEYNIAASIEQIKKDDLSVSQKHPVKFPAYLQSYKKIQQSSIDSLQQKKEKLQQDNPEDTP